MTLRRIWYCDDVALFAVDRDLDIAAVDPVNELLDEVLRDSPRHVVLDLSACEFVGVCGHAVLADIRRRVERQGHTLALIGCSARVRRLLRLLDELC